MRHVILASGSPRRKDLLTQMGVAFTVIQSNFTEYLDHTRPPAEVAKELALGKARAVAAQYPEALVIGSDTIVTIGGVQLDKPKDMVTARAWLRDHAGKEALVTSSVALICKELGFEMVQADEATVQFKSYDMPAHEAYLQTGDWADKAGGWGIQSGAAPLIAHIRGRYDTILGMPTHVLASALRQHGITATVPELTAPVPQK